jgi:hypothetical protein
MALRETPSVFGDSGGHQRIIPERKLGPEPFTDGRRLLGSTLSDFWGWSVSDLIDNITRGKLAEFIVAKALGISTEGVRDSWAAWDLTIPDPLIRIEVKSAAYLQSWLQKRHSTITFATPKTLAWDAETAVMDGSRRRHADVYVFALLAHREVETLNPLDVSQWRFFVVPTSTLDARTRSQHSITLKTLKRIAEELLYEDLHDAVHPAAMNHQSVPNRR